MNLRQIAAVSALALSLAGCATAGPDYAPPVAGVATRPAAEAPFVSAQGPAFEQAPLPDHWWHLYDDARLDALVEEALAANADLRAADANLRQADAILRETAAGRAVTTGVSGGATLAGSGNALPGTVGYDAGLGASYDLDLHGKIRRAIEASEADREAVEAARDAVRVNVAAATVKAYTDVCAANYRLDVANRVVRLQGETLDATRRLQRAGRGTAFDVSRAQAAVDASAAALPDLVAQRRAGLYLLATLVGRPPAEYPAGVEACHAVPDLAAAMPVGDGAALIRRRPDIRAAERAIAADTARIGVAMADLYPQVSIGGSVGLSGPLSGVGSVSSFGFSLGPLLSWSFPNRPVVKARIDAAGAQVDGDVARFDATVLEALRQTETALEAYARDRDALAALSRARDSAALSAQQAGKLFRYGRGDFLSLLEAQQSLAAAEVSRAAAETTVADDRVAVFRALGGGWQ